MRFAALVGISCLLVACSPHSVGALIKKLKNSDPAVRRDSAEELGRKHDPKAVDPLMDALGDSDVGVRRAAAKALGDLGDARAVAPILSRFPAEDSYTQQDFADALGELKDARALPALFAALKTQDQFGKKHISDALGAIGPAAIPTAVANLRDEDAGVRKASAECLVKIAYDITMGINKSGSMQQLEPAVPVLVDAVNDPDRDVRSAVANALGRIHSPNSIGPLIALFHDPDDDVRESDANALSSYGDEVIGPLIEALQDGDPNVRIGAARALGYMAWVGHATRAADVLNEGMAKGNLEIAAGAYTYVISRGDAAAAAVLIAAFERYPANRMGNEFLNSGNKTLADAVQAWAERHGVKIEEKSQAAGTAKWGKG